MELWLREEPRTLVFKKSEREAKAAVSLVFSTTRDGKTEWHHAQKRDSHVSLDLLTADSPLDLDLNECKPLTTDPCHGLLGLITLQGDTFLAIVTACSVIGSPLQGTSVKRIQEVDFFCLTSAAYDERIPQGSGSTRLPESLEPAHDFDPVLLDSGREGVTGTNNRSLDHPCAGLRKILNAGHFYFSSDLDLSTRLQANYQNQGVNFTLEDKRFLWNTYMIEGCLDYRAQLAEDQRRRIDEAGFFLMAIQGFVECRKVVAGKNIEGQLSLISRLSWKRAGTRYITRGIDDDGNVANFVETETILQLPHLLSSFVQIRGSIPIFWEQQGLQAFQHRIQITRSADAAQPAFERHFVDLTDRYGTIHCLNLLGQGKTETVLSDAYASHLHTSRNADGKATFTDFDFHAIVRRAGYEAANEIEDIFKEKLESANSFLLDPASKSAITTQNAVIRTNCLDCLDRTNYMQGVLSRLALESFMEKALSSDRISRTQSRDQLWSTHQDMWADNGDALSRIYAGTGAINSSATRTGTGKKTLGGLLSDVSKSVARTYINNFSDKDKQNHIDTLLGQTVTSIPVLIQNPVRDEIESRLEARLAEFSKPAKLKIGIATFNVNGKSPNQDLVSWLRPEKEADILAVGFQEIVELNAQSIVNADPVKTKIWEEAILKSINATSRQAKESYVLLRNVQLVGTALLVLIKSSLASSIRLVEGAVKKTGLKGMSGNKGAVAIRLVVHDTSICFVVSHLAAGHGNVEERNRDYWTIFEGLVFQKGRKIDMHDNVIWFGDMNYRIALPNEEVRALIERKQYALLLENDQLQGVMKQKSAFVDFEEPRITFAPTYKYDNDTQIYDSSEKQRIPAWTDRILKRGPNLRNLEYGRAELLVSDHRPVYGLYESYVRIIDQNVKSRLRQEISHKVNDELMSRRKSGLAAVTSPISKNQMQRRDVEKNLIDLGDLKTEVPGTFEKIWYNDPPLDIAALRASALLPVGMSMNPSAKTPFDNDFFV